MTPERMRRAGEIVTRAMEFSDNDLTLTIDAINLVIAFLEGNGENIWALSALRGKYSEMLSYRDARRKP